MYRCRPCRRTFNERTGTPFNHLQAPTDVALFVVLWRLRYKLSPRDHLRSRQRMNEAVSLADQRCLFQERWGEVCAVPRAA